MEFTLEDLAKFLVKAKKNTYAGDGKGVPPQRSGFDELEFVDGGLSRFIGREIILYKGEEVFSHDYMGGLALSK